MSCTDTDSAAATAVVTEIDKWFVASEQEVEYLNKVVSEHTVVGAMAYYSMYVLLELEELGWYYIPPSVPFATVRMKGFVGPVADVRAAQVIAELLEPNRV